MNIKFLKKYSPRRTQVRKNIAADRAAKRKKNFTAHSVNAVLLWLLFVALTILTATIGVTDKITITQAAAVILIIIFIAAAGGLYIYNYQKRIIENPTRAVALIILFISMLAAAKALSFAHSAFITGSAVTVAVILSVAYQQRFAIGMSIIYCMLAVFTASLTHDIKIFITTASACYCCCLLLKEIRTRDKLLQTGAVASLITFLIALSMNLINKDIKTSQAFIDAGINGIAPLAVCVILQGLLPYLERIFQIATSMTLVEYSDANQELLKRLAMEAPGTFSHSLMVGSIAEAAAQTIGRNGLLCRVGAYYHDIGKINKPQYFVENQIGTNNKHDDLTPAMSQLIITGHVKDGKEIAKEYKLPAVLRQFIETHHGTTLIEYFYDQAKKRTPDKEMPPSENEYRYGGPKPVTKEAVIVMLADAIESAVRSLQEITPGKIEAVVKNITNKRMQDGQLDRCDMTFGELAKVQASMIKTLSAHYHGRIAYPNQPDQMQETEQKIQNEKQEDSKEN